MSIVETIQRRFLRRPKPKTHELKDYDWLSILDADKSGNHISVGGWSDEQVSTIAHEWAVGDYVIIHVRYENRMTRYRLTGWNIPGDPDDQWFATLKFDPR